VVSVETLAASTGTTTPDDTDLKPKEYVSGILSLVQREARNKKRSNIRTPSSGVTTNTPGSGTLFGRTSIDE
jgi:hypothetical protein